MKALTYLFFFSFLAVHCYAQETFVIDAKKISQTETPVTIIQSISSDFPEAEAQAYYILSGEDIQSDWVITEQDNLKPGEKVDHYSVVLKGKKGGYIHAFYNAKGELQMAKMKAIDFALPPAIRTAASTGKYAGYIVKSDQYVKVVNKKTNKEYVEVAIEKGSDKKRLYFTSDGKLIQEK